MSQCEHFHEHFCGEYNNEPRISILLESLNICCSLTYPKLRLSKANVHAALCLQWSHIMQTWEHHNAVEFLFTNHTHHIKTDECHNDHVKLLVCDYAENNCLGSPTRPWKSFNRFLISSFLHCCDVFFLIFSHEGVQRGTSFVLLLIKFIDDDTDQQIEGEETSENNKEDKIHVHVDAVLPMRLLVQLNKNYNTIINDEKYFLRLLTLTMSTASSIISIQPLNVAIWKRAK